MIAIGTTFLHKNPKLTATTSPRKKVMRTKRMETTSLMNRRRRNLTRPSRRAASKDASRCTRSTQTARPSSVTKGESILVPIADLAEGADGWVYATAVEGGREGYLPHTYVRPVGGSFASVAGGAPGRQLRLLPGRGGGGKHSTCLFFCRCLACGFGSVSRLGLARARTKSSRSPAPQ